MYGRRFILFFCARQALNMLVLGQGAVSQGVKPRSHDIFGTDRVLWLVAPCVVFCRRGGQIKVDILATVERVWCCVQHLPTADMSLVPLMFLAEAIPTFDSPPPSHRRSPRGVGTSASTS